MTNQKKTSKNDNTFFFVVVVGEIEKVVSWDKDF
jgi:hypothetical protein